MFLSAATMTLFLSLASPGGAIALVDTKQNNLATNHVSYFPEVAMFPDVHYKIENDAAIVNAVDSGAAYLSSRHFSHQSYGSAIVPTSFLKKIESKSNLHIPYAMNGDTSFERFQTKHLSKSSKLHKDCTRNGEEEIPMDGPTGFFFRNTNPDAYFETYDGNLCIPIIEGNFVHFDGNKPHRTVINSGHVDLLGPIDLATRENVMMLVDDHDPDHYQAPKASGHVGRTSSNRYLEEESVDGIAYVGETSAENPEQGNFIKLMVPTGLNCTECKLALTDAEECTVEAITTSNPLYDSSLSIINNPFPIDFSIDEIGSTGYLIFVFENGLDPEDTFNTTLVLYDGDIQIACATLEELDSDTVSDIVDQWNDEYEIILEGNNTDDRLLAEENGKKNLRH